MFFTQRIFCYSHGAPRNITEVFKQTTILTTSPWPSNHDIHTEYHGISRRFLDRDYNFDYFSVAISEKKRKSVILRDHPCEKKRTVILRDSPCEKKRDFPCEEEGNNS